MGHIIPEVSKEPVVNLAIDTLKIHKQALIFVNSKRSAQKAALDIAKDTKQYLTHHDDLKALAKRILEALPHPTEQCQKLAFAIERGVAFHHAGLSTSQRDDIENAFRAGTLKLICCTPTLAAGLDMPAFRTILKDMKRYSGSFGMQYIPVLEYQQMAGRAGRPGKEDFGEAILIASTEKERINLIETYIYGEAEAIYSKLAVEPVLRTYVLSLIATGLCRTRGDLMTFFSQTFWAHHYKDMPQMERIIGRVIRLLITYEFVIDGAQKQKAEAIKEKIATLDFESAADLFNERDAVLHVTPLGQRVSQLYIDPLSANHLLKGLAKEKLTEFGIFVLLCQTLEMRPLLRVKAAEMDKVNEFLFAREEELLLPLPTLYDLEYDEFFAAVKTTQYVLDWLDEFTEDVLFEKYDIRPGEINAKNDILDWLLYCSSELANISNKKHHVGFFTRMRTRLQYGAREDLLPLLALKGIGRVRARKLMNAQIRSIADLKNVDIGKLGVIVGPGMAEDLKKQVGVEATSATSSAPADKRARMSWQQELLR